MIRVKDLMTANVVTIGPDDPMKSAVEKILSGRFRRIPVVDKGRVVGIITDRDVRQTLHSPVIVHERAYDEYVLHEVTVAGSMTPDPLTIRSDAPVIEAAETMESRKIGGLPVVDDGKLVGIITESDIFDVFLELLMAQERGIRLTALAPYFKGSMAQIASTITAKGGLIHALNTFRGEDESTWGCVIKVADISQDDLVEAVRPLVVKILDVQEVLG